MQVIEKQILMEDGKKYVGQRGNVNASKKNPVMTGMREHNTLESENERKSIKLKEKEYEKLTLVKFCIF